MNTKAQGDVGVAMAIAYYTSQGYAVSVPLGDNTKYDLIVDVKGTLKKIQCKSTRHRVGGKYIVQLRTSGGNKSSSKVKKIQADEVDLLFAYSFDGAWWEFPPSEFVEKTAITLGPTRSIYRVN